MKKRTDTAPRAGNTTITDVARRLGVSISTVSRALTRPELLRRETRERVIAAVQAMGYRPNLFARGLKRGRSRAILLAVPNLSPFFVQIFAGAEEAARERDFEVLLGHGRYGTRREDAFFEQVESGRADGILLCTPLLPKAYRSGGRPLPPLIAVLEPPLGRSVPVIRTDDREGAAAATRHLAGLGHRRIGHIAGAKQAPSTARRLDGYRSTLRALRLPAPRDLVQWGDFGMQSGALAMEALLRAPQPPTAVLCANDEMAFGAVRALRSRGLRVPEDLSIVGFDDQDMAAYYNPTLTTVHIPRHEIGYRAATELVELLEGRDIAREILLPTRLVVRESAAPAAGRKDRSGRRA
jgi:LacI family repressor for deo operon, udp, cdd, tsx, nupC, and nupG